MLPVAEFAPQAGLLTLVHHAAVQLDLHRAANDGFEKLARPLGRWRGWCGCAGCWSSFSHGERVRLLVALESQECPGLTRQRWGASSGEHVQLLHFVCAPYSACGLSLTLSRRQPDCQLLGSGANPHQP